MKKYWYVAVLSLIALTVPASAVSFPANRVTIHNPTTSSDGGPIATCRPGQNCKPDDLLRQRASDGGPIVTCRPGQNCKPDDLLRQTASDGGPIVTCRPGQNCKPDDFLRAVGGLT